MICMDTNVLVRLFVDDSDQTAQVNAARDLAMRGDQVFVPQVVQVELVWVLQSAFGLSKKDVLIVLEHMLHNKVFELQAEDIFLEALSIFRSGRADFSDCLILAGSLRVDADLFTFDKHLAELPDVHLLSYTG